jgi:FdhD protein
VTEISEIRRYSVKRLSRGDWERVVDTVAAEEPLEMRVRYWFKDAQMSQSLAVAMRTPGHDRELTAGFLVSEGIVRDRDGIAGLHPLGTEPSNEIVAELSRDVDFESWRAARATFISSSCGVCGKRSREAIASEDLAGESGATAEDRFHVDAELIERLPEMLRARQAGFSQTGGLHAAALVNARGEMECVFEDIGRHNALDKLVGHALLGGRLPLRDSILFLSSRSSFELIQKAAMAGAPVLATVGGPSSLAIDAARDCGITLLGFVREKRFNIYSGDWRIHS